MKKLLVLAEALMAQSIAYGQEEPKIKVSGYLETYFGYDLTNLPIITGPALSIPTTVTTR